MRNRMLGTWAVVIACGVLAFATAADAAAVSSLLKGSQFGNINEVSDDSVEYLFSDGDGNGVLSKGDILRGIFDINSIDSPLHTGPVSVGSAGNNQLTGVFQTKVLAVIPIGTTGDSIFVFGPDPLFAEAVAEGLGGTAMVMFYEDLISGTDYSTGGGPGSVDETNATDGKLWMAIGMAAAPTAAGYDGILGTSDDWTTSGGEGWITGATEDPPTSPFPIDIGDADFALSRLFGTGGAVTDSMVLAGIPNPFDLLATWTQITGSTEFGLNAASGKWPLIDETRFNLSVVVPIPAAAWMGFALLGGLGLTRRLRRRNRN